MADLSLTSFREKYPEYNDLSDDALAQGIHKKYYSDMPIAEFSKKVGHSTSTEPLTPPVKGEIPLPYGKNKSELHQPDATDTRSFIDKSIDNIIAPVEVATTLATAPISQLLGTAAGVGKQALQGELGSQKSASQAEKTAADVTSKLTYEPRTLTGKRAISSIGDFLERSGIQGIPFSEIPHMAEAVKPLTELASKAEKTSSLLGGEIVSPRARELRSLGKEHGVDLTYGQESGSVHAQRLEVGMKHIPWFGTESKFEALQQQTKNAARNFVSKFQTNEDYGQDIHESLKRSLGTSKSQAKVLYDDVENEINKAGVVDKVEVKHLMPKVEGLLKDYPDIFERLPDKALETIVQSVRAGVARKAPESQILSIGGSRIKINPEQAARLGMQTDKTTALTFHEARFLRDKLNNYIGRVKGASGVVGNKEMHQLLEIKSALDNDIDAFGKQTGNEGVAVAYKKANQFYTDNVVPFKDKLIDKATQRDVDTDTILKMFVKEDRPKLAKKLYERLDDQGKLAIKYGIMKESFSRALDERNGNFEPGKFSDQLYKLSDASEVTFTVGEKTQIDGLSKLMKAAENAGKNQKITNSVESLTKAEPLGATAAFALAPIATAKFAAGVKSMTWLLTSERGKKILTEVSKTPEQSARFKELVRQAKILTAGEIARESGKNTQQ